MSLITQACHGLIFTAVLGAGVKLGSKVLLRFEPPVPLYFRDVRKKRSRKAERRTELRLDRRLDHDGMVHRMLVKLRQSLHVEPSTEKTVLDNVDAMLAALQDFSDQYGAYLDMRGAANVHWSVTTAQVAQRRAGMDVMNRLQSLEESVWSSRELPEVVNCIDVVKERLRTRMLALEWR